MKTKDKTVHKGIGFCATGLGSNVCDIDVTEGKGEILCIRPYHFDSTGEMGRLNPWKIEVDGKVFEPGTTRAALEKFSSRLTTTYSLRYASSIVAPP